MTPERIQELKGRYEGLSPTDITFMTVEELTSLLVVLEEALQTIARQHDQIKIQDDIITGHSQIIARYHDALFKISQDTQDERTAAFAWSVLE
ncbi:hypothetical protein BK132_05730 [Paenibacillus sp. FSL H8-0259]|nr:hypothetical protein BK132_05730 [Paenibacillus sp. FSL H8-0259]